MNLRRMFSVSATLHLYGKKKRPPFGWSFRGWGRQAGWFKLYNPCFLESGVGAVLLDGLQSASRDVEDKSLLEFRNVDTLLLEVRVLSNSTARIELRCSSAVRISTAHH